MPLDADIGHKTIGDTKTRADYLYNCKYCHKQVKLEERFEWKHKCVKRQRRNVFVGFNNAATNESEKNKKSKQIAKEKADDLINAVLEEEKGQHMAKGRTGGKLKSAAKRFWNFVWNDNSVWSWIFNAALAFVIIKFLVYPGLGLALQTESPVVAVISDSMRHNGDFDKWWASMGKAYASFNISKDRFMGFTMSNGFKRGDLILLKGKKPEDIQVGEVLVFRGTTPEPVIHRVVKKWKTADAYHFSTKGDANAGQREEENEISTDRLIGTGWIKLPYLGYVKILFTDLVNTIRGKAGAN